MLKENLENIEEEQALSESSEAEVISSPEIDAVREEVQHGTKMKTDEIKGSLDEVDVQKEELQQTNNTQEKLISDISSKDYFEKFILPKMDETVEALGLAEAVVNSKAILNDADPNDTKDRTKAEKSAVRELVKAIDATEFKKWSFTPEGMTDTKSCNCSGAALVFAYVMNEKLGVKTKQASPYGHAVNVVYYADQSTEYVDPRNSVFYDLKLNSENMDFSAEGYDVFNISKGGLEYKKLPVIDYKEGAANTLLNNTVWMDREKDNDEEARDSLSKYADSEKLAFAQHFSSSRFLESRVKDPVWIDEKKSIDRRRLFQKIPVLGRFI